MAADRRLLFEIGMPRTDRGFTLVEALVTIGLLIVLFAGVASVVTMAGSTSARSRAVTLATIAAGEQIERLQALPLDDAALIPSPPGTLTANVDGYWDVPAGGYTRRWSIEPLPSFPGSGVVVRVLVSTRAGTGDVRLVSVKTQLRR